MHLDRSNPSRGQAGRATAFMLAGLAAVLMAVPAAFLLARAPAADSQYDRLAAEIGCQCGTCPNRPIATCGCGFADQMLVELQEAVGSGADDPAILQMFVTNYGPGIRIKPDSAGIGLAAWLAPMMLLLGGAVAVAAVLSHWRDHTAARTVAADTPQVETLPPGEADSRYRQIVERELEELPD